MFDWCCVLKQLWPKERLSALSDTQILYEVREKTAFLLYLGLIFSKGKSNRGWIWGTYGQLFVSWCLPWVEKGPVPQDWRSVTQLSPTDFRWSRPAVTWSRILVPWSEVEVRPCQWGYLIVATSPVVSNKALPHTTLQKINFHKETESSETSKVFLRRKKSTYG